MTSVAMDGKKKKPLKSRLLDQKYLFLLMIPGVIWVLVICYAPMTGLYMAFTNYRPSQNGYFYDLFNAKYGTAVGLFKSVVSFILVMSANKITAKLNDSALF